MINYVGEYPEFSENNNLRWEIFHRLYEKMKKQWTAKQTELQRIQNNLKKAG